MKNIKLILLIFFLGIGFSFAQNQNSKVVIAYIAGWKEIDVEKIPADKFTHINYAFANVVDGVIGSGSGLVTRDSINIIKLQSLKTKNPNLKILVSVGGWTWSKGFSDAVLTKESRTKLTQSGINFLIKHQLDGLDFDWEYPALQGDNNVVRAEDKENFVSMLESFRNGFDSLSKLTGKYYLSSIASGGFRKYLEVNDLRAASKHLDLVNIMSYDLFGPGDDITGHHANLYPGNPETMPFAKRNRSVETAVKEHLEYGVSAEKLVLGIPFYGKRWKNVSEINNGLNQPAEWDRVLSHFQIQELQKNRHYIEYWDNVSQNSFLYSSSKKEWITYESPNSIQKKIIYMNQKGLAGIMFWELSEDPSHELLNTINQYIK